MRACVIAWCAWVKEVSLGDVSIRHCFLLAHTVLRLASLTMHEVKSEDDWR